MIGNSKAIVFSGLIAFLLLTSVGPMSNPPGAVDPYLNGIFPDVTPGFGGSWYLEESLTEVEIIAPLKIIGMPGTDDVLILCKTGQLWQVNLETQTQKLVLDITDRTINYSEAGTVSIVLHPEFGNPQFPDKQVAFIFYRTKPEPKVWSELGYNRLSKFSWDTTLHQFDENSEEILIQQYDRSSWHNGGGLFFEDGLLYLGLGDEGEPEHQLLSNQRLDRGLFCGLIRIDVDNDPTRSHPIRRQPVANEDPPEGWNMETFSQGYSIPNDNPWQSPSGEELEEFFAIGIRSPYSMHFDKETKTIWLGDVGSNKREEINLVEMGDNLQWNFREANEWAGKKPEVIIGNEKEPLFHYGNEVGGCIIGGGVYRAAKFLHLNGRYVFADFMSHKIMALQLEENEAPKAEVLLSDFGPEPLDLKEHSGISGLHYLPNGDILATVIAWPFEDGGKILHLRQREAIPDPPSRLSELGVFSDLENLTVVQGIFPYEVNAPLWSDRAVKRRWMAIPNDGLFNEANEQIQFSTKGEWQFPEGTVFIKHFDLPTSYSDPTQLTKLETRFFIMAKNNTAYGLTYKWNEDQTDAFLQVENTEEDFDIFDNGQIEGEQTWSFPGRDQCLTCHNSNADFVLGVNTHQLNSDMYYPNLGTVKNQLQYLSDYGIIDHTISDADSYPRAYHLEDESATLDERIRSYLDSNCSSCHQVGGVNTVTMDLRFHTPLNLKNIIKLPTLSQSSNHHNLIVEPGNHGDSELWIRDQSADENRMPPIASNLVDEEYIESLAEWIDGLSSEGNEIENFVVFPNPSSGWMILNANSQWELPLRIDVHNTNGQLVHTEQHDSHVIQLGLQRIGSGNFILSVSDAIELRHSEQISVH